MGPQSTTTHRHTLTPLWITLALLLLPFRAQPQTAVSATTLPLILPSAIVFDPQGNLYLAETARHVIRKVNNTGAITIVAGTGTQGFSGDSGPAIAAQLDSPQGLAIDANNLYIADTHNHRIRKLNLTTGTITTIAGSSTPGFDGDNNPAVSAHLNLPTAIAIDPTNNLYIADTQNHRIRKIDTAGIITTIAGNGTQGFSGDSGAATSASIDSPTGLAADSTNLYLADTHNHRIREIDFTTGIITTIAGNGDANATNLALPRGLTLDASGNLYLADTANQRIRRIDTTTGQITTIAGQGTQTFAGDNAPATSASLDSPRATATSPTGLITLADTGNQRIRQISADATIHTIAGLGATTPGALTLSAPSIVTYGTGKLTATLSTTTQATGAITFLDTFASLAADSATLSPITLGTAPITANSATFSTTTLPAGHHSITAIYPGDLTHASAQSPTFSLTISPRSITAAITPSTLLYGQPIPTLSATLNNLLQQDVSSLTATFTTTAAALSSPGTYPITATLTGPAAGNYTLTSSPANLIISPAPTLTSLTASATTINPGLPITLSTHIASTTTGQPTGTVSLVDGTTTLFTAQVTPTGDATFTTAELTQGIHNLTTRYSGDANFLSSTSTPQLIGIGINPNPDFTLATTGDATQTIPSGGTATFNFAIQFQGAPLSSPITLSASGLPNLATAAFNPAYIPPGSTTSNFSVTITTPKTTANQQKTAFTPIKFALIFFPIAILSTRRRKTISLLALIFLAFFTGCGDRIYTGTQSTNPTKIYTIAITGTATTPTGTTLVHTATVTLQLQQPPTT